MTIIEASQLKKMDTFGQNDVYCLAALGGKEKRTKTIYAHDYAERGDPQWKKGKGAPRSHCLARPLAHLGFMRMPLDKHMTGNTLAPPSAPCPYFKFQQNLQRTL